MQHVSKIGTLQFTYVGFKLVALLLEADLCMNATYSVVLRTSLSLKGIILGEHAYSISCPELDKKIDTTLMSAR